MPHAIDSEGFVRLYKLRYCPRCTQVVHFQHDSTYAGKSKNPAILVKRINKKTNDWFFGCPNFPRCTYSENRPQTMQERNVKTWAWANAYGGY